MGRSQVEVPGSAVLAVAGGVAWLLGTAALRDGVGTVVLALGLTVTVWLTVQVARADRDRRAQRLDRDRRRRVLLLVAAGVGLVVLGSTLLRSFGQGELTVPLVVALCGMLLVPLSSLLDRRGLLAVGAALMVLGAAGAVLALNTPGREAQGVVGLVGGVLLWLAAAVQAGLLRDLRHRIGR